MVWLESGKPDIWHFLIYLAIIYVWQETRKQAPFSFYFFFCLKLDKKYNYRYRIGGIYAKSFNKDD